MIDDSLTNFSEDKRHLKRAVLMQSLFSYSFYQDRDKENEFLSDQEETKNIINDLNSIDQQIAKCAPERPLKDINKVDLAILRLIVFESQHSKTPKKVLINEAIELAKEFGSESSPKFINGVLAKLLGEINGINKDIYTIIVQVIHEVTGLERNEIDLDSDLTEDLGIDPVATFPQIIKNINEELNVDLPLNNPEFISELKKCDTIADLVDLIETESEFNLLLSSKYLKG